MKIVLLIPKLHVGSELAVNQLLEKHKDLNIVGIVRSDVSPYRWKYWRYMIMGVSKAGVFYGAMIALMSYWHIIGTLIASLLIWNRRRNWHYVSTLCRKLNIPLYDTENINSKKSQQVLKSWSPDIIVCLSFDQILKKAVLDIPTTAALNVHPGLLPKYKGLWPEFWNLLNKEKYTGITIHHMIEEIDAGEAIAQTKFPIEKGDTKFCLSIKSAQHGVKLLTQTLDKMKRGIKIPPLKISGKARYYSLPTKAQFEEFSAQGGKLFSVPSLCKALKRYY